MRVSCQNQDVVSDGISSLGGYQRASEIPLSHGRNAIEISIVQELFRFIVSVLLYNNVMCVDLAAARIMGRLIAFDSNVMELPHEA
jgi:hypothetical protein